MPLPAVPAGPISTRPELLDSMNKLLPSLISPAGFLKLAKAIWPNTKFLPFE